MDYGQLINIVIKEIYEQKCKIVLVYDQGNYTFVKYPDSTYDARQMLQRVDFDSKVVLGVCKEDGEVMLIRGYSSILSYVR